MLSQLRRSTCIRCGSPFRRISSHSPWSERATRSLTTAQCLSRRRRHSPSSGAPMRTFDEGIDKIFSGSVGKSQNKKETPRDLSKQTFADIIKPVVVKPKSLTEDDINVGEELAGKLDKAAVLKVLINFFRKSTTSSLAKQRGMDEKILTKSYMNFREFCVNSELLPIELHVTLSDIINGEGHVDDLFPYFYQHATKMFPHLVCMEELLSICDLRRPSNWYSEARGISRKIIYHAGPTNSGKTHHAIENFLTARTGIYCGPLRMLASEIFHKSNANNTPCDLVTGECQMFHNEDGTPCSHVSCTVEMAPTNSYFKVAVIDEIQMLADLQRGWAWTRALLGIAADEVHLCGDASAIEIVQKLMLMTGDEVEIRKYDRLTPLTIESQPMQSYSDVRPGDAVVAFSKSELYDISRRLDRLGVQSAVIYGGLPPEVKKKQSEIFNDPENPCKVLVATDAIGMGLNLNIRRVIFNTLLKPTLLETGEKTMEKLSTTHAKQIAGRAGRFRTQFPHGYVSAMSDNDLAYIRQLLESPVESVRQVGLNPTADQLELFAFHLPEASLSNLIDVFMSLSKLDDDMFFMCNLEDLKFFADTIQHIPIPIKQKYVLCCSPISQKEPFACAMFLKISRQFSNNEPITFNWFAEHLGWPLKTPETIVQLAHMECVYDVCDMYLWLSLRFADQFPDATMVRDLQQELTEMISLGIINITKILMQKRKNSAKPDPLKRMKEVKEFAEKASRSKSAEGRKEKLNVYLQENSGGSWIDVEARETEENEEEENERKTREEAAMKEKVFNELVESSGGKVSRSLFEKIYEHVKREKDM